MDFRDLLTSFDGRINRAKWWLGVLIIAVAAIVASVVLGMLFGWGPTATGLINLIVTVLLALPVTAIMVKRLKDRDRPLWLVAVFWAPAVVTILGQLLGFGYYTMEINGETVMMPDTFGWIVSAASFVIGIWSLIELGILKGTEGPNRYGPDPLAGKG